MRNLFVLFFLLLSFRLFGMAPELIGHTPAYTLTGGIPIYTGFYCNSDDDEAGLVTIKAGYASNFQKVVIDGEVVMELNEEVSQIEINLSKYVYGYERDTITHRLQLQSAGGTGEGELYFCRSLPTDGGCVLLVPATYEGMVIGVNPATKNVYVPSEYWVTEEYSMPITSISDKAFNQASEMETLYIPGDIASIQFDAFKGCTGLQEVRIEDSENRLSIKNANRQSNLFPDSPIKKIYIGRTITNTSGSTIAPFKGLKTLEEVSFTSSAITLDKEMFADCTSLKDITIPVYATWPEGQSGGSSVDPTGLFSGCTALETVTILTRGVSATSPWMFFNCSALTNVKLPQTIETISVGTFSGCESLTQLPISNLSSLSTIGQYAFAGCNGLDYVQLPSGVTTIESRAFQNCQNLKTMIFPTTLKVLGQDSFAYCDKIREVFYLAADNLSYAQSPYIFEYTVYDNATLYVLKSMTDRIAGGPWNRFSKVEGCENARLPFIKFSTDSIDTYWTGESKTVKMDYTIIPEVLADNDITWESSNTSVVDIKHENEEYFIDLNSFGEAVVRATLSNGNYAQCNVRISPVMVESLSLFPSSVETVEGEKIALTATVLPEDATDKTLEWSSSDEEIATVDETGNVEALKEGNCVITARTTDGSDLSAECQITVVGKKPILIESLSLDPSSIEVEEGETFQIIATLLPEDATDKTLEWSSSDEDIATVDEAGLVSVLKEGNCVITARTTDGSDLTAECHISITTGIEDIFMDGLEKVDLITLEGIVVKEGLSKADFHNLERGVYILRKSNKVKRLIIR